MFHFQTIVTEKCNLSCSYCYMNNRNSYMSKYIFDKGFDFTHNILKPHMEALYKGSRSTGKSIIAFFGGEPLINFKLMEQVSNDSKYNDLHKMFPTNGLLLTSDLIEKLDMLKISYNISFDGLGNIINRTIGKESSLLSYNDYHFSIMQKKQCKCMIAPNNLTELSYLFKYFIDKDICMPDFTLIRDDIWNIKDGDILDKQLDIIDNIIINSFKNDKMCIPGFYSLYIADTIIGAKFGKRKFSCFADGIGGVCLFPNGKIYPCARFGSNNKLILADINKNKMYDKNIKLLQNIHNPENFNECKICELYNYCNSQCNYSMLLNGNNKIMSPIKSLCHIMKIIYKHTYYVFSSLKDNATFIKHINLKFKEL